MLCIFQIELEKNRVGTSLEPTNSAFLCDFGNLSSTFFDTLPKSMHLGRFCYCNGDIFYWTILKKCFTGSPALNISAKFPLILINGGPKSSKWPSLFTFDSKLVISIQLIGIDKMWQPFKTISQQVPIVQESECKKNVEASGLKYSSGWLCSGRTKQGSCHVSHVIKC